MPSRRRLGARRAVEPLDIYEAFLLADPLAPVASIGPRPPDVPGRIDRSSRRAAVAFAENRPLVLEWWRSLVDAACCRRPAWSASLEGRARESRDALRVLTLPWIAVAVDFRGRAPRRKSTVACYLADAGLELPARCRELPEHLDEPHDFGDGIVADE